MNTVIVTTNIAQPDLGGVSLGVYIIYDQSHNYHLHHHNYKHHQNHFTRVRDLRRRYHKHHQYHKQSNNCKENVCKMNKIQPSTKRGATSDLLTSQTFIT